MLVLVVEISVVVEIVEVLVIVDVVLVVVGFTGVVIGEAQHGAFFRHS